MKREPYEVTLRAHGVSGRYQIPESTQTVWGLSANNARATAIINAHIKAHIPSWKPYLRESWRFSSAEPVTKDLAA